MINLACDGFRRLRLSDGINCHCSGDWVKIGVLIPVSIMVLTMLMMKMVLMMMMMEMAIKMIMVSYLSTVL